MQLWVALITQVRTSASNVAFITREIFLFGVDRAVDERRLEFAAFRVGSVRGWGILVRLRGDASQSKEDGRGRVTRSMTQNTTAPAARPWARYCFHGAWLETGVVA